MRVLEPAACLGLYAFFALLVGQGEYILAGAMAAGVLGFAIFLYDPRWVALAMLVGSPTIFVFANNILGALPFVTLERLILAALFGITALSFVFNKRKPLRLSPIELVMLLFLFVMLVSFITVLPERDMPTIRRDIALLGQGYVMPLLAFWIASHTRWPTRQVTLLLGLLVGAGIYLALVGAAQYFLDLAIFTPKYFEVIQEGRASGTFASAVEYGGVLVALMVLAFHGFARASDPALRAGLLAAAGLMVAGVGLSLTRAPMVALLLALMLIFALDPRTRPILLTGAACGAVIGVIAAPFLLDLHMIEARMGDLSSIFNRVALYATAVNMIAHNPFMGIGFGRTAFADAKWDYITSFAGVPAQYAVDPGVPHNEYLHVAVLTGLPGLFLYLAIFYATYRRLTAIHKSPLASRDTRDLALYVRIILASYVVMGLFSDIAFGNYHAILVFFLAGLVVSRHADEAPVVAAARANRWDRRDRVPIHALGQESGRARRSHAKGPAMGRPI